MSSDIHTCQPNPEHSYTKQYQKHIPSTFCYNIKYSENTVYKGKPVTYTAKSEDDDVAQIFLEKLEELRDIWRIKKYKDPAVMIFTEEDKRNYDKATTCHICGKDGFVEGDEKKNKRDHCNLTNRFRGAAHAKCNRNYQIPKFMPVVFHNLSNYDSHLFEKACMSTRSAAQVLSIPLT